METITPFKQTFMADLKRHEPAARDSTAIVHAKKCLRLYFYRIVLGYTDRQTKPYFRFGSAYHVFMEVLEKSWYDPIAKIGDKDHKNEAHVDKAIKAAMTRFGKNDPPVGSRWDFQTSGKLMASCLKAYKKWKNEKKVGAIEVVGIEQEFEIVLKDGKTRRGGKADQFVKWNSELGGKDFKTSSLTYNKFERGIDPNDQFDGYLLGLSRLADEHVGFLLVDTLFNRKPTKSDVGGPEIKVYTVTKTPYQLNKFEEECIFVESLIDKAREEDIWPMNQSHCWNCIMRSVCKKGTERSQMNQLEAEFRVEPWDYKTLGQQYEKGK